MSEKIMWKRAWRDQFGDVHSTHAFFSEEEANNQQLAPENSWCGEAFSFQDSDTVFVHSKTGKVYPNKRVGTD